ncbi:MAG: hypothetical protein ACRDWW_01025 [Acidimicrobiales bacterium]
MAAAATSDGKGFWIAWSNGAVTTAGDAHWYGDASTIPLNRPIVGIAATPDGGGYWLLGGDGGVFSYGDAGFYGSTGGHPLNAPALQMQATSDGHGYRFVAGDGGIFTFGDAGFYGSMGGRPLNKPVVGMASTRDGGYWLVGADGGIFSFGDAPFYGSAGDLSLAQPVVGMARTPDGGGYWLVARDGGVFTYGDAGFFGSGVGRTGGVPAVSIVATGDGGGYWIVLADGQILSQGDAGPVQSTIVTTPQSLGDQYSFEVTNSDGVPARWNPCETIHYAVVYAGAPAGWQSVVSDDMAAVQAATGFSFAYDGAYADSSEVPSSSQLTLSWTPNLTGGDMVGLTTYWYYTLSGFTPQLVSAEIQLKTGLSAAAEEPVLLHELGHSMGLGHVTGREVMNPVDMGLTAYQPGDLGGLWRLGATQGCAGFYR